MATIDTSVPPRRSGLLLHVTSLPSSYGIGDLGPAAYQFIEDIAGASQQYWQMLPIGPTGFANSPYQGLSTFAGNTLMVSPDLLIEQGLLTPDDTAELRTKSDGRVDFGSLFATKPEVLTSAARRFHTNAPALSRSVFLDFKDRHDKTWLGEFALFAALKAHHDHRPWTQWGPGLALRHPDTLVAARSRLKAEIEVNEVLQFLFFQQWESLRAKAKEYGVLLVGDLPLYMAHDSADVWASQDMFLLDEKGRPTVVSGVPPDYFSETGQRWGNPIYDWSKMAQNGFGWWRRRMSHVLELFDLVRIDHFRGLAGYWEIPAAETTAVNGRWVEGPGEALMDALAAEIPAMPIIAEDLGVITDNVVELRERYRLPGMRIAQFGFDAAPDSSLHHPDAYPANVWAYTGTHDNDTTAGWFWEDNPEHQIQAIKGGRRALYDLVGSNVSWGLIEMVAKSKASTAIYPVQELLEAGREGRMNTPATTEGNWEWRLRDDELMPEILQRLRDLTETTGRTPSD